ncbi:N-terminal phage integrase SAM-like domain-containing protein [Streptomyces gelaticus]|uniref:N-terminal phage integrase SAM-like domain-containing protein n=1 Tax=Streptomyces gelaticus TaxID=285446 RepID=UPI00378BD112
MATNKMTIVEYLTYWLANIAKAKVRPTIYVNYESLVRNYITPELGRKKLVQLTARDIRAFLTKTAATCQCCAQGKDKKRPEHKRRCCSLGKCCKKLPSDRTVRFLLVIRRAAIQHAVREDELPRSVARNVGLSMAPSARSNRSRPRRGVSSWWLPGTTGYGPRTRWRSASASGRVSCWGCAGRTWISTRGCPPSVRLFSAWVASC